MINRLAFALLIAMTISWSAIVTGHIKDSITGKSIPNANITILETGQGTASNPYGYFKLDIAEGIYTIETFSFYVYR